MKISFQIEVYDPALVVCFRKTKERFGGLSNMAGGFPVDVDGIAIRTSEALYQACRFPDDPAVQRMIIAQRSPMTAKMKSKRHLPKTRSDWETVRVEVMRWCVSVKLAQNWEKFERLLLSTGDAPIVEQSRRDVFWGAQRRPEGLVGANALGRLLVGLREALKGPGREDLKTVDPLRIPNFLLDGQPIGQVGPSCRRGAIEQIEGDRCTSASGGLSASTAWKQTGMEWDP